MRVGLLILAVIGASQALDVGLRVRFNVGLNPSSGKTYFYEIARTIGQAILDGWTKVDRPDGGALPDLPMYCSSDYILCGIYDSSSSIAGLQIAFPEAEFTDSIYDWTTQGYVSWSPDGTNYWATHVYFISEDTTTRSNNFTLPEDSLWVDGFNSELYTIPKNRDTLESDSAFTIQACIPWMGRHFYYEMSSATLCQADTMFPWFPLVHEDEVIGVGHIVFGQFPENENKDWFERPPKLAVQAIVPRGPDCLYELASSPGLVTMHIYFVDNPWDIGCLSEIF